MGGSENGQKNAELISGWPHTAYIRHQYVEYTAYIWPIYGLRPLPSHGLYTGYVWP